MKLFKWLYPKDLLTWNFLGGYIIDTAAFIILWLIAGQLIPSAFGFEMPRLTLMLIWNYLVSWLFVIVYIILVLAHIIRHSILRNS